MGLGSSVGVLRAEGGLPLPGREVVGRGPGRCDSGRGTDDPRRWEEGQRRATPSVAPASPGSLGGAGGRGGGLGSEVFSRYWKSCQELSGGAHDGSRAAVSGVAPVTLHPERAGISRVAAAGGRSCQRDRGWEVTPPAAGLGRVGAEPGSRRPPAIGSRGRGTLSGSGVQISCEQAQTQEVTVAPGNASGPRFPDMVEKLAPGTGQLDVVAWWTVGDWAGRSEAWRGWRWRNSKLLSPPQPH